MVLFWHIFGHFLAIFDTFSRFFSYPFYLIVTTYTQNTPFSIISAYNFFSFVYFNISLVNHIITSSYTIKAGIPQFWLLICFP